MKETVTDCKEALAITVSDFTVSFQSYVLQIKVFHLILFYLVFILSSLKLMNETAEAQTKCEMLMKQETQLKAQVRMLYII